MILQKHTLFLYVAAISFAAGSSAYIKGFSLFSLAINAIDFLVLLYCLLRLIKNNNINKYTCLVILLYMLLGFSTVLGTSEYSSFIVYAVQGIGATVFINYELSRYPVDTVRVLRNVLMIFIALNAIQLILLPNGFYGTANTAVHLLGYRIAFTPFVITEIFFSLLYDFMTNEKNCISAFSLISVAAGYFTVFIKNISTGIITLTVVLILLAVCNYRKLKFDLYSFFIIYAVLFVGIIIFNIQYHDPIISYFLVEVLGKNLTFDNRTTIWNASIKEISDLPILGHGITGGGGISVKFKYRAAVLSAHNQILNLMWEGGAAALAVFLGMSMRIARAVKNVENNEISYLCSCAVIGFFVLMFTEVQMTKALIFLLFATVVDIPKLMLGREWYLEAFREYYALRTDYDT